MLKLVTNFVGCMIASVTFVTFSFHWIDVNAICEVCSTTRQPPLGELCLILLTRLISIPAVKGPSKVQMWLAGEGPSLETLLLLVFHPCPNMRREVSRLLAFMLFNVDTLLSSLEQVRVESSYLKILPHIVSLVSFSTISLLSFFSVWDIKVHGILCFELMSIQLTMWDMFDREPTHFKALKNLPFKTSQNPNAP